MLFFHQWAISYIKRLFHFLFDLFLFLTSFIIEGEHDRFYRITSACLVHSCLQECLPKRLPLESSYLCSLPSVQRLLMESGKLSIKEVANAIKADLPLSEGEFINMRGGVGSALYRTGQKCFKVSLFLMFSVFSHPFFQEQFGSLSDGVCRLPSFKEYLDNHCSGEVSMFIGTTEGGEVYSCSVIFFDTAIETLLELQKTSKVICYATDFTFQYTQGGGFGNIWGLVSADSDGNCSSLFQFYCSDSFFFLYSTYPSSCNWTSHRE